MTRYLDTLVRFIPRLIAATVLATLVLFGAGCGGSNSPGIATTDATTAAFATEETAAVQDRADVYGVEVTEKVLHASITTTDGIYTLAQVDSDIDSYDDFVPEVNAHFVADDYADDGLAVNATLRLRGQSSRLAPQKSYRLKLSKSVAPWRGETTLQLNKHPWDLTRVRNKLAFDLFREIPHLPSLRTQFMHLTVNSEDYGLFTHVEKMGKDYLSRRGLPTDGNIYKANDFSFHPSPALELDATGAPKDVAAFERVLELENDNKNHGPLLAMIAALNDETQPFSAVFNRYFDPDNYLAWLAVNILVGNHDTSSQNFALYQPKDVTRFYFLPWDYDGAFGLENQPDFAQGNSLYPTWRLSVSNWWGVPLHRRFLQDPANVLKLKKAVDEIYGTYLTNVRIKVLLDRYRPLVAPLILRSPDYDHLPTVTGSPGDEWANEYSRLVSTIRTNYENFTSGLEHPMPFWQSTAVDGETLRLSWDEAVDLQHDPVTYTVMVADNPQFNPLFYSAVGLSGLSTIMPKPHKGVYYLRVVASDNKGNRAEAFDVFYSGTKPFFGVLPFAVE